MSARTPARVAIDAMSMAVEERQKAHANFLAHVEKESKNDKAILFVEACIRECDPGSPEWKYWSEMRTGLQEMFDMMQGRVEFYRNVVRAFEREDEAVLEVLMASENAT